MPAGWASVYNPPAVGWHQPLSRLEIGAPFLLTVLDSGSDALLPIAEHAAAAAGKWVAEKAPDVVRDRLLPRFIESFRDAA